jgi:hypothetical protein
MALYGDVELASLRLLRCPCQGTENPATVSPLCGLIPDRVAPERLYLEARWASLVPYAAAAGLLADILPMESGANATTLREHTLRVAERAEAELEDEQFSFITSATGKTRRVISRSSSAGHCPKTVTPATSVWRMAMMTSRSAGCSTYSRARVYRRTRTSLS